jgi:hypothetical protein
MQSKHDPPTERPQYILTWSIIEGVISIIEAWLYREMPSEGWECHCDRGTRVQEDTCHLCGASFGSSSRDVLHVYNILREIVNFIADRSA